MIRVNSVAALLPAALLVLLFSPGNAAAQASFSTSKFDDIGLACADANKEFAKKNANNGKKACISSRVSINADDYFSPKNGADVNYAKMNGDAISVIWVGSDKIPRLAIQFLGSAYKQCNGNKLYQKADEGSTNGKGECAASNRLSKSVGLRVFSDPIAEKDWDLWFGIKGHEFIEKPFSNEKFSCFINGGSSPPLSRNCTSMGDLTLLSAVPTSSEGSISYSEGFSFSGTVDQKGGVTMSPTYSSATTKSMPSLRVNQRQNGSANVSWIYSAGDNYTGSIPNGEFAVFRLPSSVLSATGVSVGVGVEYTMWIGSTMGKPFLNTYLMTLSAKELN